MAKLKRRSFTPNFKAEAVQLCMVGDSRTRAASIVGPATEAPSARPARGGGASTLSQQALHEP